MKILCIGDVVGSVGCEYLRRVLPALKQEYGADICIVNGENAADGNGLVLPAVHHLFDSGADVITSGNHVFRRPEFVDQLDELLAVLRPANYTHAPGTGVCTVDRGRYQVTVINLMGTAFMEPLACPFDTLDALLAEAGHPKFCVVDFHAEATAEKKALAYYADGRISALFGTHTHVQTADEQILPQGTGYLTDVGMTGPKESVLGILPQNAIDKMRTHRPVRFTYAPGDVMLNGVLFELDDATGRTLRVERIQR